VLVHGWGGSFRTTWQQTGFTALLDDAGREVIGVDLLGHGGAPKPHDPEAYADLTERVLDSMPTAPVDAVGFSLGALTLLRTAVAHPQRFRRLVLAGIGRNVFERDDAGTERILAALDGSAPPEDTLARLFAQYAGRDDNDPQALAAVLRRPSAQPLTPDQLMQVVCPVLVVVGEDDFVHPADELVGALPHATSVVLRKVDHFATPESFGFVDAALEFIGAAPT
jgi:pimeloyl-ACP methyl ester carboxylesterase